LDDHLHLATELVPKKSGLETFFFSPRRDYLDHPNRGVQVPTALKNCSSSTPQQVAFGWSRDKICESILAAKKANLQWGSLSRFSFEGSGWVTATFMVHNTVALRRP